MGTMLILAIWLFACIMIENRKAKNRRAKRRKAEIRKRLFTETKRTYDYEIEKAA